MGKMENNSSSKLQCEVGVSLLIQEVFWIGGYSLKKYGIFTVNS